MRLKTLTLSAAGGIVLLLLFASVLTLLASGGGTIVYAMPEQAPLPAGATGPENFDYVVADSTRAGGPVFNFEDISRSGTPLSLGDDAVSAALPLPFDFVFYGRNYTEARVSSDGFLTFLDNGDHGCCEGGEISSPVTPNGMIAGWWADLNPTAGGAAHYQVLGVAPHRRFIVQFSMIPHFSDTKPVTFQYKLFEGSGAVEVHYRAAPSDGATHTAGIENREGDAGLLYYRGSEGLTAPLAVRYSPLRFSTTTAADSSTPLPGETMAGTLPPKLALFLARIGLPGPHGSSG